LPALTFAAEALELAVAAGADFEHEAIAITKSATAASAHARTADRINRAVHMGGLLACPCPARVVRPYEPLLSANHNDILILRQYPIKTSLEQA
jgi:hypothetical protein